MTYAKCSIPRSSKVMLSIVDQRRRRLLRVRQTPCGRCMIRSAQAQEDKQQRDGTRCDNKVAACVLAYGSHIDCKDADKFTWYFCALGRKEEGEERKGKTQGKNCFQRLVVARVGISSGVSGTVLGIKYGYQPGSPDQYATTRLSEWYSTVAAFTCPLIIHASIRS